MVQLITLHTKHTTYQMGVTKNGFLLHLYYGSRTHGDMSSLLSYYERGMSGVPYDANDNTFSCDVLPQEYSCYGNGDYRSPAINVRTEDGTYGLDLRYQSYSVSEGHEELEGLPCAYGDLKEVTTHRIVLSDRRTGTEVVLSYGVFYEHDIITRNVRINNPGKDNIYVHRVFSCSLDFLTGNFDILSFHGRHMMERIPERTAIKHGKQCYESRRGTSSHEQNPFIVIADESTNQQTGACYGMSFMYSGNFMVEAEKDQFEQTRVQMGLSDEMFDYKVETNRAFIAPQVILSYTQHGLNALSQQYHQFIRHHVCRGKYKDIQRPVLINHWEATYFDFDGKKIIQIAEQAAELGIELFVLDDGWFGRRGSDRSGLGDWYVNEAKLGCSLSELGGRINRMGLKFGIWIEPEMVNEDSDLYRSHPEWVFQIPEKKPVMGRNQLVLDFSNARVVDYIYEKMSDLMKSANIEYLKMDMNRSISDVYSTAEHRQNYGSTMYKYMLGVYDFLNRIHLNFPDVLLEGCSSGGGRFDAGMLYYTPQIWCSDDTDAIERLTIQEGTSYGYPVSAIGAHVSAAPNHQTGRMTSIRTRGMVAMFGNLGYELDCSVLSDEERELIKKQIKDYKKYWKLIHRGLYYRGDSRKSNSRYATWNVVSEKRDEALLIVVLTSVTANAPIYYAKCYGLEKNQMYLCHETGKIYSSAVLETIGIPIPIKNEEYFAWQFYFSEL